MCSGTPRDCHVAHGGETTGVGASCIPGTMVLNLADRQSSASICRLATAGPYPPPEMPIDAGHYDGTSTEVHLRSPVRSTSVPVALGWYQGPSAVSLSFAPHRYRHRTSRRGQILLSTNLGRAPERIQASNLRAHSIRGPSCRNCPLMLQA